MDSLKVITCNARGLSEIEKCRKLFKNFHEAKYDIILLQETHCTKEKEKIWRSQWDANIVFSNGTSNARGVAVLFSRTNDIQITKIDRDSEGRFLFIKTKINDFETSITNVYAPNHDSPDFFEHIFKKVIEEPTDLQIFGDFNVILNKEDKKSRRLNEKLTHSAKSINAFLDNYEWLDVWKVLHPNKFGFTWRRRNPLVLSRLDYFLLPMSNLSLVGNCEIIPNSLSDHSMVLIEIDLHEEIRGRGYWQLNNSFLTNKEYVDEVNKIIDLARFRYAELNPGLKIEMLKKDVTEFSMYFGKINASKRKTQIEALKRKLKSLEKRLNCINLAAQNVVNLIEKINCKIDSTKEEINTIESVNIRGTLIRSKARFYEEGEKNTKYFFNLEKSNAKKKIMKSIE